MSDTPSDTGIIAVVNSIGDLRWVDSAACSTHDISLFFVDAGRAIEPATVELCQSCPVRVECVTHAYTSHLTAGYFGGFSPGQRRSMTLAEAIQAIESDNAE